MKNNRSIEWILSLSLLFIIGIASGQQKEPEQKIRLFYLGGQSNMDGYGFNKDLPDQLDKTFENVWIFHGNTAADDYENGGMGIWEPLMPGHGVGSSSDDSKNFLSERFGLELSFAQTMAELYPGEKIAIIKYSRGGTSIDTMAQNYGTWDPDFHGKTGINQYDHFLTTLQKALSQSDIDGDGKNDKLVPTGIAWMQGESDATVEKSALRYEENLKRLIDLIRAAFRKDDLPVAIGKISDSMMQNGKTWRYGELVQHAQEEFVRSDKNAIIVRTTQNYGYSDPWHYDSKGYIDLGIQFAKALFKLSIR